MRILIATDIFPPEAGGPARYVPIIAEALTEAGHAVRVITYSRDETASQNDGRYSFRIRRISVDQGRLRRLAKAGVALNQGLKWADLVYANGLLVESALINALHRRPVVAKVVGDIAWERARDKGWIADEFEEFQHRHYGSRIELRRRLRNRALRQTRAVIVPSAYLKRIVTGWGIDADRVHVIYNAFEPTDVDVTIVNIPLTTPYRLITVCRLVSWKGVNGLIETIASLPDAGLVVVGDGPERDNLEALAGRLRIGERVYFAGQVPRAEVPAYLRACDLFVLNSSYEGLPHAVLEALAAGRPVVATAAGGTPEVIQNGVSGRLVPVGDRRVLREAITEMLDTRTMNAFRHHMTLPEAFGVERMVEATTTLLEAVAGGRES